MLQTAIQYNVNMVLIVKVILNEIYIYIYIYIYGKKIKNIIKSEVRKTSLYHRGKYVTTLEIRGKLLISHDENNKHVCKKFHSLLKKSSLVFRKFLFFTFNKKSLNSIVMAK